MSQHAGPLLRISREDVRQADDIRRAVFALKRPDPWPRVAGYHEVFHLFVVAAAAVQWANKAGLDSATMSPALIFLETFVRVHPSIGVTSLKWGQRFRSSCPP